MGRAGAVDPDQHLPPVPGPGLVAGELLQRSLHDSDVILGGVRAGVPGPQPDLQRLPGPKSTVVDEHTQRVEPEPAFECRLRQLLLRVRPDQGGVHIHDQRLLGIDPMIGGMVTGHRPNGGPGCGAGGVDRGQRRVGVGGECVDGS